MHVERSKSTGDGLKVAAVGRGIRPGREGYVQGGGDRKILLLCVRNRNAAPAEFPLWKEKRPKEGSAFQVRGLAEKELAVRQDFYYSGGRFKENEKKGAWGESRCRVKTKKKPQGGELESRRSFYVTWEGEGAPHRSSLWGGSGRDNQPKLVGIRDHRWVRRETGVKLKI